jgi:hypothetical protein
MFRFKNQCIGLYPYFFLMTLTLNFNHQCVFTLNFQVANFKKSKQQDNDSCCNYLISNIQDRSIKL